MAISIPIISEFVDKGVKSAIKEFKQLETTGQKAQFAIKKAAVPAAAALAGVTAVLGDATKAAIEDAAAQSRLARNIKNATGATDKQIKGVEDAITSFSKQAAVSDDELRPAFGKLVTMTKDVARAQHLMKIALDASAATGKPLEAVTMALVKAEGGQYAALKKLGIPMTDNLNALVELGKAQKALTKAELDYQNIQDQVAMGYLKGKDGSEALAKAHEKLTKQQGKVNELMAQTGDYADDVAKAFSGAAADAANTAQGQFKRLKISLDETKEAMGAALVPAIEKALPVLNRFADWAQEHPQTFLTVAKTIAGVAAATQAVNAALAVNPYVLAAAALIGLAVAFDRLADSLERVSKKGGNALRLLGGVLGIPQLPDNPLNWKSWVGGGGGGGGGKAPGQGQLPIPAMANGGIVTSPTLALIGEAGPEAVVPLNKAGGMGSSITVNVNGGDPQAIVDTIRRYMRQNGAVPIRTVGVA